MRFSFCLLVVLGLSVTAVSAQKEVNLYFAYQPQSNYEMEVISEISGTMDMEMPDSLRQSLGNLEGFPMQLEMLNTIPTTIKTGQPQADGSFEAILAYGDIQMESRMNGSPVEQPDNPLSGLSIYGRFTNGRNFEMDSVSGKGLDPTFEGMLKGVLGQLEQFMQLPTEPMAVGEEFTVVSPMSIPMAGMNPLQAEVHITYHLTALDGDRAYFDLDQEIVMDMQQEQMEMHIEGRGSGQGTFNVAENYWETLITELPMEARVSIQNAMEIVSRMQTKGTVRVRREPLD